MQVEFPEFRGDFHTVQTSMEIILLTDINRLLRKLVGINGF